MKPEPIRLDHDEQVFPDLPVSLVVLLPVSAESLESLVLLLSVLVGSSVSVEVLLPVSGELSVPLVVLLPASDDPSVSPPPQKAFQALATQFLIIRFPYELVDWKVKQRGC